MPNQYPESIKRKVVAQMKRNRSAEDIAYEFRVTSINTVRFWGSLYGAYKPDKTQAPWDEIRALEGEISDWEIAEQFDVNKQTIKNDRNEQGTLPLNKNQRQKRARHRKKELQQRWRSVRADVERTDLLTGWFRKCLN